MLEVRYRVRVCPGSHHVRHLPAAALWATRCFSFPLTLTSSGHTWRARRGSPAHDSSRGNRLRARVGGCTDLALTWSSLSRGGIVIRQPNLVQVRPIILG